MKVGATLPLRPPLFPQFFLQLKAEAHQDVAGGVLQSNGRDLEKSDTRRNGRGFTFRSEIEVEGAVTVRLRFLTDRGIVHDGN